MWSNIRAGLGPARPNEGTAWFRAGLGHCFYTSGWHGTAQKLSGLSWPKPVWHETRWAWAGPARHGPIPSTIVTHTWQRLEATLEEPFGRPAYSNLFILSSTEV
jgi:hypothetical protein